MFVSGLEMTEEMPFNCVCVRVCVCVWVRERTVSHQFSYSTYIVFNMECSAQFGVSLSPGLIAQDSDYGLAHGQAQSSNYAPAKGSDHRVQLRVQIRVQLRVQFRVQLRVQIRQLRVQIRVKFSFYLTIELRVYKHTVQFRVKIMNYDLTYGVLPSQAYGFLAQTSDQMVQLLVYLRSSSVQGPVQVPVQGPVQGPAQGPAPDPAQSSAQGPAQGPA